MKLTDFLNTLRHGRNGKPGETAHPDDKMTTGLASAAETKRPTNGSGGKMQIHNLIIIDESGSMSGFREVTLSGVNETIGTIREAQKEYGDKQDHFLTLVTFDTGHAPSVRTLIDGVPIDKVSSFDDYSPCGCTPLYDAMGDSLSRLKERIKGNEDATGVVTVLTDGLENSSSHWNAEELRRLIEQLKEEGWTFSYMGSAHNVKDVSDLLSIDNVVEFSHDMTGASNIWGRERSSKRAYYSRMASEYNEDDSWEERKARMRQYNLEYYQRRVTPPHISTLEPDEVFVFGSNTMGYHNGGAAATAMDRFGAVWGQGDGLQGQSYAIPTMEGIQPMEVAILRFCQFAKTHPELKFLVTRVGCGIAGYSPKDVAPLFREAIELENVSLPRDFWEILGLKMFD